MILSMAHNLICLQTKMPIMIDKNTEMEKMSYFQCKTK